MNKKIMLFESYADEKDIEAVTNVIKRGTYWTNGLEIEEFEKKIAEFLEMKNAIAFNSGTSALYANLLANNITSGEVIVPSFTFPATINSVIFAGAKPVFADIEEKTLGLDSKDVEKKITENTKAIMPIHFAGAVTKDIKNLRKIADDHNLLLIEDNAQSLGAKLDGKKAGSFGHSSATSFCFNKIITTGEGGMVITNSDEVASKLKMIRSHGRAENKDYITAGLNLRMSTMNAALGLSQFKKLDFLISKRREIANFYNEQLKDVNKIKIPLYKENNESVYCTYNIIFEDEETRNSCIEFLKSKEIPTRISYNPVHLYTYFKNKFGDKECSLPITEKISKRILTIPLHLNLTKENQEYIVESIKQFLS